MNYIDRQSIANPFDQMGKGKNKPRYQQTAGLIGITDALDHDNQLSSQLHER